jgi:hypothetical protein
MALTITACGPLDELETDDLPSSFSGDPSQDNFQNSATTLSPFKRTLYGVGIPKNNAPGCTPAEYNDFIDAIPWDNRRLEPRDCAVLNVSRPVFYWPLPKDLNGYMTFTLNKDGKFLYQTKVTTPRFLYPGILTAATYQWTVQYQNTNGVKVTSALRRFSLAGSLFKIPTGDEIRMLSMGKAHPRARPWGKKLDGTYGLIDFARIAELAKQGEYKASYQKSLDRANSLKNSTPPSEKIDTVYWYAGEELLNIETLSYLFYFTGSSTFQDLALKRLMNLASWDPKGVTGEATDVQANRAVILALGAGLDLLHSRLSSPEMDVHRKKVVNALRTRLKDVLDKYSNFDKSPYDSFLNTSTFYTTQALMHSVGTKDFPEAEAMLVKAWNNMIVQIGFFGGNADGGYGNGSAYGWYMLSYMAPMVATVRLIADVNLTRWPAVGGLVNNQIAFAPPYRWIRGQFGDGIEDMRYYFAYNKEVRLMAAISGNWDYEWYWRMDPDVLTTKAEALNPTHYLLLGIQIPQAPPASYKLPNSYLFQDAGYIAMHSNTMSPDRSSVFFRSSRYGSTSHTHADNNAFTLVSKGKDLLISAGYYHKPKYLSPHHSKVRGTRFHNALTYNGGIGQAEPVAYPETPGAPALSADARGKLTNFVDNGTWVVATGDASLAYRGLINSEKRTWRPLIDTAIRSVVYNRKKGVVVIYDWAAHSQPRGWELNFQPVSFQLIGSDQKELKLLNDGASACLKVYGPPMSVSVSAGLPDLPQGERDYQTVRYGVKSQSKEFIAVTVIREGCGVDNVTVQFNSAKASISIGGDAPLVLERRSVTLP